MPKAKSQKKSELEILKDKLEKVTEANRENQRASYPKGTAWYAEKRRREKGEVLVAVWVPKKRVAELKQIAKAMCLEKPKSKKYPFGVPIVPVTGKAPGWSYVKVKPDETWLQTILKANKAQWQGSSKKHPNTWKIRSDLVKELGLTKRVVADDSVGGAKPKAKRKPAPKSASKKPSRKAAAKKS